MNAQIRPLHILAVALGLLVAQACQKDEVAIAPKVETIAANSITLTTAKVGGTISSDGGSEILAKGICYGTAPSPTVSGDTTNQGNGSISFEATLTDLQANTTYYARAYATNKIGTSYGSEVSFKTNAYVVATVTTANASGIKGSFAYLNGEVTNDNDSEVTEKGFVYSTTSAPTINDTKITAAEVGVGQFGSNMTDLNGSTTYYVRAYAINLGGVAYGNEISFTTLTFATLTTKAVTAVNEIGATSGGTIVSDGGNGIGQYGLVWSENEMPTFSDANTILTAPTSDFNNDISPLKPGRTYYVRAYALTAAGFAYGNQVSFTTPATAVLDGLVAYYKFDGDAKDYSGNNFNLTPSNISYTTDKTNTSSSAVYLNGSAKLTGSINFESTPAASVSLWFNSENSGFAMLYSYGLNVYGNSGAGFGLCNSNCDAANYGNSIPFYEWHHVVGTYDGANIKLYLDGQLVKTEPFANPSYSYTSLDVVFGTFNNNYWQGKLDKVKFYNRALTATDVTALSNE